MTRWDLRFIEMASLVASWSKDPSTKVGAVITNDKNHVVSLGFNGFPRGVEDRLNVNRETKLARTIHAEACQTRPGRVLDLRHSPAVLELRRTHHPVGHRARGLRSARPGIPVALEGLHQRVDSDV